MADGLWFPAYETMARHPKVLRLAGLMGIKRREAIGLLVDLFTWALRAADRDGAFRGLCAEDIAVALDYSRKSKLTASLVEAGWLEEEDDGTYRIHDWEDYTGRLYDAKDREDKKKKQNSDRIRRFREREKEESDSTVDPGSVTDSVTPALQAPLQERYTCVTDSVTQPLQKPPCNADVTVYKQEHKQEQGQEEEQRQSFFSASSASVTPEIQLCNALCDAESGPVVSVYLDKINKNASPRSLEILVKYVKRLGADVCMEAINRTRDAGEGKVCWSYLWGILKDFAQNKVHSLADVEALDAKHEQGKSAAKPAYRRPSNGPAPIPDVFGAADQHAREDMESLRRLMEKDKQERERAGKASGPPGENHETGGQL